MKVMRPTIDTEKADLPMFTVESLELDTQVIGKQCADFNTALFTHDMEHKPVVQKRYTRNLLDIVEQNDMIIKLQPYFLFIKYVHQAIDLIKKIELSYEETDKKKDDQTVLDEAKIIVKAIQDDDIKIDFLQTIPPQIYMIPTHKLANELPKDMLNAGEVSINVGGQNKKEKDQVLIVANFSDLLEQDYMRLNNPAIYSQYDAVVYNAVISLYVAGNEIFTPDSVYRTMTGAYGNEYINNIGSETLAKVIDSIEKLRHLKLTIDFTDEAIYRNKSLQTCYVDDMLLSVMRVRIRTAGTDGGTEKIAYQFNTAPILYEYVTKMEQVASVPLQRLQTKRSVKNTEDVIVIREYLIRRIEGMKNPNNNLFSNRIKYKTIFDECRIDVSTSKKKKACRDAINKILNEYIRQKYVIAFNEYKSGREFVGIQFQLDE